MVYLNSSRMRKKKRGTEVERGNIKKSLLDEVKGLLECITCLYFTETAEIFELFLGHLGRLRVAFSTPLRRMVHTFYLSVVVNAIAFITNMLIQSRLQ